jgi:hypothetical protein
MFKQGLLLFKVLEIHCNYYKQAKEPMLQLPPCQQCHNQFVAQQLTTQLLGSTNQSVTKNNFSGLRFSKWKW